MCGIAGFNWPDRELGSRMIDSIVHRGPDQQGVTVVGKVTLGAVRLAIIDLSPQGSQPMRTEDGRYWIVYNGETYNFREVRRHLEARGHVFKSGTDTEVVLRAYVEHGPRCLDHLRGMFAFAIYDAERREFFLARDAVGIKPLYYRQDGGRFAFASEIKALLEDPTLSRDVDPQAIYDYLGWEFVPAPRTMFRGVQKLPAGHYLIVREESPVEVHRYWHLVFEPEEHAPSYYRDRLREILDDAVRRQLVSDVPLGVFLSGGLDSSAVVAYMRRHVRDRLRTFTLFYDDPTFSELEHARLVARAFGAEQHEIRIQPISVPLIEESIWHLDEPMTDLSAIPFMLICREARRQVTVCLSGEGGDEIFVGYDRFRASRFDAAVYRRLPSWVRRGIISPLAARLPDQPQKKGPLNIIKRYVDGADLPPAGEHLRWQYFLPPRERAALFRPQLLDQVETDPFVHVRRLIGGQGQENLSRLAREIYLDFHFIMCDSVLMKVDKMSMASSLEVRVPLLDQAVVEFAASIPDRIKFRGLTTKAILRRSLAGILPPATVRRGKQGYSLPIKNWLREELRPYMTTVLNESPLLREHLNLAHVNRLIAEHAARTHNHNHILWGLLNLAAWHKLFVLGSFEWTRATRVAERAAG